MVDALALREWSSGTELDFRKDSPPPIRDQHNSLVTASGSIGNDQEWRRFILRLRGRVSSVVSAPTIHRILPTILEEVKSSGWLTAYSAQIDQLNKLPINWNSYGSNPPNFIAIDTAREVLDALWHLQVPPSRVAPLADEGIVIWLTLNEHQICIESLNSGTIVMEIGRSDGSFEEVYENKTPSEILSILDTVISLPEIAATADVSLVEEGGSELPSE